MFNFVVTYVDDDVETSEEVVIAKNWKQAMNTLKRRYTDDKLNEVKSIRIAK